MTDTDETVAVPPPSTPARLDEPPDVRDERLAPGTVIGDYDVERTISVGGCGVVYAAIHRVLAKRVAVKVLLRDLAASPEMSQRFVREARIANQIRHPNIVDIIDFGELSDGRPYFVMEFLPGETLGSWVRRKRGLTPAQAVEVLQPVCDALCAAHEAGVVHRDLKASNVQIEHSLGRFRVKLLDFGIAKLLRPEPGEPGLTSTGQKLGSPSAMAPEQIRCEPVDVRADVYGLGILLFFTLTGRYPFRAESQEVLERMHLEARPPDPSEFVSVPGSIDAVVRRCLEKKPAARFPDVRSAWHAFREAVESMGTAAGERRKSCARALALCLEADLPEETADDPELLGRMATALDAAEQLLVLSHWQVAMALSSGILGVRVLPNDPSKRLGERAEASEMGRRLLQQMASAGMGLRFRCSLCEGDAEVELRQEGESVTGGPILDVGRWAAREGTGLVGFVDEAKTRRPVEET